MGPIVRYPARMCKNRSYMRNCVCGLGEGGERQCQVIETRDWTVAFSRNGFLPCQENVGEAVKKELGIVGLRMEISNVRPTLAQLRACFPGRSRVPVDILWKPFHRLRRAAPGELEALSSVMDVHRALGRTSLGALSCIGTPLIKWGC